MTFNDLTVRPARATDRALVRKAFDYAGAQLDPLMDRGLGGAELGSAIPALRQGIKSFAQALSPTAGIGPDAFSRAALFASTVLVIETPDGQPVGAAAVRPCLGSILATVEMYPERASEFGVKGLAHTAKLVALAVLPEQRSKGIGRVLLNAIVDHYRDIGAPMIYGIIEGQKTEELTRFYETAGFHVLEEGRTLDLSHVFGVRTWVRCDPGERYFYQDLQDPKSRRWEGPKPTYRSESKPQSTSSEVQSLEPKQAPLKNSQIPQRRDRWRSLLGRMFKARP